MRSRSEMLAAVLPALLPLVTAYPGSYFCNFACMNTRRPSASFGYMGIPEYSPAPTGDHCKISVVDVPESGYIDGEQYKIEVTSLALAGQKVVCNDQAIFVSPYPDDGLGYIVDVPRHTRAQTYKWNATGSSTVIFHALCGNSGGPMWVADGVSVARSSSQPTVPPTTTPPPEPRNQAHFAGGGLMRWDVNGSDINFTVSVASSTWLGFGLSYGDELSMDGGGLGSDIVACQDDPPVVKRYWVTSTSMDPPSGGAEVVGATCTRESGTTTLSFQRPLAASEHQRPVTLGSSQPVIWAFGQDDDPVWSFHGPNSGGLEVDFASGSSEETRRRPGAALLCHLILMTVCWGGVLPWGVAIASRGREVPGAAAGVWFRRHRALQSLGLVGMLLGFACGVWACAANGSHFNGPHTYIGMAVVTLGVLQPLNAVLRPHAPGKGEKRSAGRLVFELAHKGGGWLAVVLGALNVVSGVLKLVDDGYDVAVVVAAACLAALCLGPVLVFLALATVRRDNPISRACLGIRVVQPGDEGLVLPAGAHAS